MKMRLMHHKTIEAGSHRPYAALLYMGYTRVPSSVWSSAYVLDKYNERRKITNMFAGKDSFLVIYE